MLEMVADSPNTLSASWVIPDPANGIITGYTIRCSTPSVSLLLPGTAQSAALDNLVPFTQYQCSISANTSAGEGPATETQIATTDEDGEPLPPHPRDMKAALLCKPVRGGSLISAEYYI